MKTQKIRKSRLLMGLIGSVAITFFAGCQSSQTASTSATSNSALSSDDGVICKMEKRVGSNMMTRVCRTAEQRTAEQEAGRDGMLRLQGGSMTSNADGS